MKFIKYIAAALLIVAVNACDFLDKDPTELKLDSFYSTDAELESALLGAYSPLMQETFYGNAYALDLAGGDDLSFFQRSSGYTSIMCANANSSTPSIASFWRILYEGVNRSSIILEKADLSPALSEAVRNRVKAEAKFLRAFYYFHLVQCWGDVPLRLTAVTDTEDATPMARTNKQVIYDQIINDIEEVIESELLPSASQLSHTGTITQTAAQGILARIYLFRAGEHNRDQTAADENTTKYLERVKYWAGEVIASNVHELVDDYSQVFIDLSTDQYNSTGKRESMWEAEMAGTRSGSSQAAGRIGNVIGFGSTVDYSGISDRKNLTGMYNPGYSYRFVFASLKMYEIYEEENDWIRGDWNIAPYEYVYESTGNKYVTGRQYFSGKLPAGLTEVDGFPCTEQTSSPNKTRCAAKYRREMEVASPKNKNYTPINFPILRYSDVLLMYAEAENELNGPTQDAQNYINAVRQRAGLADVSASLDKDGFREIIKRERAMELCYEGLRRWDLIRWGDYLPAMKEMSDSYVNKTGWNSNHAYAANYYQVTDAYIYFPIPDTERSTNPLCTQNTGW